jgi:riboflavin-specific deaminase-like protein
VPSNAELRPRITVQAAQTLDGKIALSQTRTLLSSPEGLEIAHRNRAAHDAVMVGSSTVRIDDPELSVRYCSGAQPKRIVLASSLDIPANARVLESGPGVLIIGAEGQAPKTRMDELQRAGAEVHLVSATDDGLLSMRAALTAIYQWGVRRLLVEGGARVLTTLFRERLVDYLALEIVPVLLGNSGVPAVSNIGVGALGQAPRLADAKVRHVGTSIMVEGRMEYFTESN